MRKKTEARREAILDAATQEFAERGYEGTSMSSIVARLGGSKQTLYGYFASKDDLFVEVMLRIINRLVVASYTEMTEASDVGEGLRRYGELYLRDRLSPEMIGLARLAFGEAGRTEIGRLLFDGGKAKGTQTASAFLAAFMKEGKLRTADPNVAALHYFALLDAELFEPVAMRVRDSVSDEEIVGAVARAVDVFLAAYGPRGSERP